MTTSPIIAVTMGDGAGVGPEVVVPALLDEGVLSRCNPVVIGDAKRLRQAADILGIDAKINAVASPGQAVPTPGIQARAPSRGADKSKPEACVSVREPTGWPSSI